jgi:hypothetical protein
VSRIAVDQSSAITKRIEFEVPLRDKSCGLAVFEDEGLPLARLVSVEWYVCPAGFENPKNRCDEIQGPLNEQRNRDFRTDTRRAQQLGLSVRS